MKMNGKGWLLLITVIFQTSAFGQKYMTEKSFVTFFSDAAIEDITADNHKSSGIFDSSTGEIAFSIPIGEFEFDKSLMKEHFNEKYMETSKYPRSTFQGEVIGFDQSAQGVQEVKANGKLNIHGITHDVEIPGTIDRQGDKLLIKSKFIVKLEDYKVKIPQLLWQNIAEQVEVTVDFVFAPQ